jgi:AcrR family transcriptional regulator
VNNREALTEAALEYVFAHGLLNLSLRPLAAAIGTSDRMLIYHFGSKARLIAEVLELANRRVSEGVTDFAATARTPQQVVEQAWQLMTAPGTDPLARLYLELCALSVRDAARWADAHRRLRAPWLDLLYRAFVGLKVPARRATVLATLVLDTLDGLMLDKLVTGDPARIDAAARAFAQLLAGRR